MLGAGHLYIRSRNSSFLHSLSMLAYNSNKIISTTCYLTQPQQHTQKRQSWLQLTITPHPTNIIHCQSNNQITSNIQPVILLIHARNILCCALVESGIGQLTAGYLENFASAEQTHVVGIVESGDVDAIF